MTERPIGPLGVDELIGERVHAAMWRARITQVQLARELGLDQAAINRRLRGRTPWKVTDVIVAARVLGVSVEDLMPKHDELGHVGGLTRGNVAAESRCTQARAEGNPLGRAAQLWRGKAELIHGHAATDTVSGAATWAVAQ